MTAEHVARYMNSTSFVSTCGRNHKTVKYNLKDLCLDENVKWSSHSSADMSIIELDLRDEVMLFQERSIKSSSFINSSKEVTYGTKLKVIGFPLSMGIEEFYRPFIWETYSVNTIFASLGFGRKKMSDFIYVALCMPRGNSGGPVVKFGLKKSSKTIVAGIAHGYILDSTRGDTPILGYITPAYYFFEIVEKLQLITV